MTLEEFRKEVGGQLRDEYGLMIDPGSSRHGWLCGFTYAEYTYHKTPNLKGHAGLVAFYIKHAIDRGLT